MIKIDILDEEKTDTGWKFRVRVSEGGPGLEYEVDLSEEYWKKLTQENEKPQDLVKRSFKFLLVRETKEAILRSFNLNTISKYFADFEDKISI